MTGKPELPEGYLGAQTKFQELGMTAVSHPNPEMKLQENEVEVRFKTKEPIKVTATLINCAKDVEYPEYVFSQTQKDEISFLVSFPESGYYKLQLYALPIADDSKKLPGVFNYLVNVVRALKPVHPYPKAFAQWKKGCYLHEPQTLHKGCRLANVPFKALVPGAHKVAIVVDGEWSFLEKDKNEDLFTGKVPLDAYRGTDKKITLNANFGEDETKFTGLLEYSVK